MSRLAMSVALAAAVWGCEKAAAGPPPADGPVSTATVKITDVCGAACVDALEARLRKLDGIVGVRVRGYDRESRFYFNLQVAESKSVLPSQVRGLLEDWKKETNGEEDFGYGGFEITAMSGIAERAGDDWRFTARGSNCRYDVVPNDALKRLLKEGKSGVTLAGKVFDDDGRVRLEVSDAKETAN